MGMLEGAMIGAVVGAAVSAGYLIGRHRQRDKVLRTLEQQGAAAAEAVLDKQIPAVGKIPMTKILPQRERMAGLALIGDLARLESEVAGHTGAVTAVAQVNAIAMLGLTVRGEPAVGADMAGRLAGWTEAEGGRAIALVKKKVRALAHLAAGVAGKPVPDDAWATIDTFTREGGMVEILACRAIAIALRNHGKPAEAETFEAKVRVKTSIFDRPPSA